MKKRQQAEIESLAYIINSVEGVEPSKEVKKIIHLYAIGKIDLETAKKELLEQYHS